ncbi:hypothetical protein OAR49_01455 [Pelagibacteraceae bacterium]|nr:hypothetical protein [Pelagibacteraceae bacterium]
MKFSFIILFFVLSCSPQLYSINQKKIYTAKGFAYIYNDYDFNEKIIKGKLNNEILQISHQNLRIGTLLKISNPKNNESVILQNIRRIKYPDFYKILITKSVAERLKLNKNLPILEITEIKKNKSFVAKKAKVFSEEKKIPSKAPVASVQILNISKNKEKESQNNSDKIYIHIASFYSMNTAKFLRKRIKEEIIDFDNKKLKIKKINDKETQVISGPYISVNLLKKDYIKLKSFGFEELDIFINE